MTLKMNKGITSKLVVILLVLLEIVVDIRGAPVSTNTAASVTCPPPHGACFGEPEETCTDDSECKLSDLLADEWIGLCCPHACREKRVCRDTPLPTPPTTIRPTTEGFTTTKYSTQPRTSTKSSTIDITTSSSPSTNPVTTNKNQFTTTTSSTNKPTTIAKATSTEMHSSTQEPSTTASRTTARVTTEERKSTSELPTKDLETTTTKRTTTERPTTTQTPTTTEIPTTKQSTTRLPPSTTPTTKAVTTPTTQEPRPGPSVCGHSDAKDILFIIDGTVNYRQYRVTRKKEWNQIKHFIKEVILELEGNKFRIGVMQYGGRREPRMEVDIWEGADTANLRYQIDDLRQIGGVERMTGKSLAIAGNKFYELNSLYGRASAQDIVVLITRGRPSDKEQTIAEVEMLKRKMVRVIAIGVSLYPRYLAKSLQNIASFSQDAILSKYSELGNKETDVLQKICLPVKLPGTESLCRNKKVDIHFVLDGSRSINPSEFDKKRKFLKDVFFLLESPSSDLNIGMMQFSTVEKTEDLLELQKHSLNEELDVIKNMEYHSGRRTMLGDALSQVNDEVFNGHGGDRSAVENVLVIFSDGRAHDITTAYREADYMKERNVRVITTTVSDYGYVPDQLRRLATHPKYALSIELSNTAYYAKKLVSMICLAKA